MLLRFLALSCVISGFLALPLDARAADAEVGGKGVRSISLGEPGARPILVDLDRRDPFAPELRPVPGVDIRIEGAREVIVLPDGTVQVRLGRDD